MRIIKILQQKKSSKYKEIRDVISKYSEGAKIYLGGIPMIADDMMTFIKSDIVVFGLGVFIFIILTLWIIFKNLRWVAVPLIGCIVSVLCMIGLLGFLGWKVTVISSNFIALMLILNMAMNIHVTVRYLQIRKEFKDNDQDWFVLETTKKMFMPILYTVLTTIFAFMSLIFSGIKPIIDFGWMMTLGLLVSLIITFLLVPSIISSFAGGTETNVKSNEKSFVTNALSKFSQKNSVIIFGLTILIILLSIRGISKLEVENSFINYFDKNTEIYKGMKKIDDDLGGTTPLDIIIKFPVKKVEKSEDDFEEWEEEEDGDKATYWFTRNKIDKILNVHDYLDFCLKLEKCFRLDL